MALLHRAELRPSKLELVAAWAPSRAWFEGDGSSAFVSVGSFRFDDPDGEVGVETLLVRAGDGPVLQVPLTYRNEQLPGAEEWFLGTMEHSVLGTRWTYDAVGDPVYRAELARAILSGGTEVEQWIELDGVMTLREPTARVVGTGKDAAPDVEAVDLEIVRVPSGSTAVPLALMGTWTGQAESVVLATASKR